MAKNGIDLLLSKRQIVHSGTNTLISSITLVDKTTLTQSLNNLNLSNSEKCHQLLKQFPELLHDFDESHVVKHQMLVNVDTGDCKPILLRPRRFNPSRESAIDRTFENLIKQGIVEKSTSEWGFPVSIVGKPGKELDLSDLRTFRVVTDFRLLNKHVKRCSFPIPSIQSIQHRLAGSKIFSSLDLRSAYYSIPVDIASQHKLTAVTTNGSYSFKRLPFGLKSSSYHFQLLISKTLQGIPGVATYLDDILIYSEDFENHLITLKKVFRRLSDNSLLLNIDKCKFAVSEITYLGHSISDKGVTPLRSRITDLENFPLPDTVKQLRRYIGMYSFYHRFLKNCSEVLAPLHKLVTDHGKRRSKLNWTDSAATAFENSKKNLCNMILLHYPQPEAVISIQTDASQTCAGCVLQQTLKSGITQPIGCFSKSFNETQKNYSTFDRELLAAYMGVRHFRNYLIGESVVLLTDHKPLVGALHSKSDPTSALQQRYLSYISQYVTRIEHISGNLNYLPDVLSRKQVAALAKIAPGVSLRDLALAQKDDDEIESLLSSNFSYNYSHICVNKSEQLYLLCDFSQGNARPIVPRALRQSVFDSIHNLSHPGGKTTSRIVRKRFTWPNIRKDIISMARSCMDCQRNKVGRNTITPLKPIHTPNARLTHLHLDLVGPLPSSNGYTYLLTINDRFTKFPVAMPLRDITTETIIDAFLQGWISFFGTPLIVTTDQGPQFMSNLFQNFLRLLGIQHNKTTAYHPIANGHLEQWHRRLKASLMTYNAPQDWYFNLPLVLLGLRTAIKTDLEYSPIEMILGSSVRLPGAYFDPLPSDEEWNAHHLMKRLRSFMRNLKAPQTRLPLSRKSYVPSELSTCSHVWMRVKRVKRPLEPPYIGPFPVVNRYSKFFTINRNGKNENVSLDNLKPAFTYDLFCQSTCTGLDESPGARPHSAQDSPNDFRITQAQNRHSARQISMPRKYDDYEVY